MSVAATSINAWFEINVEGIVAPQKQKIYRELYTSLEPKTAGEICEALGLREGSASGRLNAMADEGHVERCGKRPCKVTGRTVETWRSK